MNWKAIPILAESEYKAFLIPTILCHFSDLFHTPNQGTFCQKLPHNFLKNVQVFGGNVIHMFLIYSHFLYQSVTLYKALDHQQAMRDF